MVALQSGLADAVWSRASLRDLCSPRSCPSRSAAPCSDRLCPRPTSCLAASQRKPESACRPRGLSSATSIRTVVSRSHGVPRIFQQQQTRPQPSSFAAAGDRLFVHLSSSKMTASLGDTWTSSISGDTLRPRKKEAETLEFEACQIWRKNFRSKVSPGASRPTEAMIWSDEIESVKSIDELKMSNTITRAKK